MKIIIHPHAKERIIERGATEEEIITAINEGESFPAKFGRKGFRHNFNFDSLWRDRHYNIKQLEVYAVYEDECWIVITAITKYF